MTPQPSGETGDDLEEVVGHLRGECGLLPDDRDLTGEVVRVVGADLRTEPVLERRDDAAAVRVVLRVRGGDDEHVQGQAQHIAADLHIALLHDGQQRDLDALRQVGQLIDRDDAAVRAGHQAEVDRLRVAQAAALCDLHRVDVADHVCDGGVRCGELLDEPLRPVPPHDGEGIAVRRALASEPPR